MSKVVFVVRTKNEIKVFSDFDKARSYVEPLNYRTGLKEMFKLEEAEAFDVMMDRMLSGEYEKGFSEYSSWKESRLEEFGLTADDIKNDSEIMFIETVDVL